MTYDPYALHAGEPLQIIAALGLCPAWMLVPHFDNPWMLAGWTHADFRAQIPAAYTILGVDENTALLQVAGRWQVWGAGRVTIWPATGAIRYLRAGDSLAIPGDLPWGLVDPLARQDNATRVGI